MQLTPVHLTTGRKGYREISQVVQGAGIRSIIRIHTCSLLLRGLLPMTCGQPLYLSVCLSHCVCMSLGPCVPSPPHTSGLALLRLHSTTIY